MIPHEFRPPPRALQLDLTAFPLILTLRLDPVTFARLDALRQARFPDRGYRLPAHQTLFHALPWEAAGDYPFGGRPAGGIE